VGERPGRIIGGAMSDPVEPLILDLLEWIGRTPRPYADVMEAWRTSCPRLPVWEEANARGYLEQRHAAGSAAVVVVTDAGRRRLAERAAARPGGQPRPGRATR
jgi:hypothetical protein